MTERDHRIDRRTALKLAGLLGAGALLPGTATASDDDGSIVVDPEIDPPWEQLEDVPDIWLEDRWFVSFAAPPTARGGGSGAHANERASFQSEANQQGVDPTEVGDFTTLWNGLAVEVDLAEAIVMSGFDSVEATYPVAVIEAPDPEESEPMLETALTMTGADHAQAELGYSGAGVSVGIVDTGIDYNHPDLGGDGDVGDVIEADPDRSFDHPRISHGWDYVGDDVADPTPNADPMDDQGHGTHVAGIAGADAADGEGVTGVAPSIEFGAYKVFPPSGSTTGDIIVAALEDAYVDDMDVVNMSIGASLQWGQEYPTTAASNELVSQGVVVTNSAGNDGALGVYTQSPPGNAHDAINVASVDNEFFQAPLFHANGIEDLPYDVMTGSVAPPLDTETDPLALPALSEEAGEEGYFGCQPEDFDDFPEDHVAVVQRGHCPFAQKYTNAVNAGASGVILYNNAPGLYFGTIEDAGTDEEWVVSTSNQAGTDLVAAIEAGDTLTATFTDDTAQIPNPSGGLLSSFSSFGQTVELVFGPDVAAPGGSITSTYPLGLGEYAVLSGTSMAAPHTAGAAALLLEAEGSGLDPIALRDRLQNTAEQLPWSLSPGAGLLDHSFRQGAGLIQVDQAIEAAQGVEPGRISAGDGDGTTETLTIYNDGDEAVEYEIGNSPTLGMAANPFAPTALNPGSTIDAPDTVAVPAGGSTTIDVTINAASFGWPNHQYGGYVTLTTDDEDATALSVPYAGYEGDYLELSLFGYFTGPGAFVEQTPNLAEIVGEDADGNPVTEPVEAGHEFTVAEDDYPVVEAFFGHFPQRLQIYAVHEPSGQEHLVTENEYLPRSPDPSTYQLFPWPGVTQAGRSNNTRPVPSGTYTLRVEALRATGDPDNEDHLDVWESPAFELDSRRAKQPSPPGQSAGAPGRND